MLKFEINEQKLTREDDSTNVADTVEYLEASFTFEGSGWENTLKSAIFKSDNGNYIVVLDESGKCKVPAQALVNVNGRSYIPLLVSAMGVRESEEYRITTNEVMVQIHASGYVEGETPGDPEPDVYAEILKTCKRAEAKAQDVEDRANAGEFIGKTGQPGEKGERGEQGIQGVQGEKGEKGEPGTTDYNELANVPIKNIQLLINDFTMLVDIEDGMYFVQSTGYIKTTGGKVVAIGVGTEIIVVTYSGVKAMTYQTGKTVSFLNDSMTSDDKVYSWLNTSHKDLSISSAATDDMLPTSKAVYTALQSRAEKVNIVTFENGAELNLINNTEYFGKNILSLTLNYPEENFECYISFDIPAEGAINISLDQSKYIGSLPNFANGKSYEISIKNGVVICGEVIK